MLIACVSAAYLYCAWYRVHEDLSADPLRRPGWAYRPTLGKVLLFGALWWFSEAANAKASLRWSARDVGLGALNAALKLGVVTATFWGAHALAGLIVDQWLLRLLVAGVILLVGRPLIGLLVMAPLVILGALVRGRPEEP